MGSAPGKLPRCAALLASVVGLLGAFGEARAHAADVPQVAPARTVVFEGEESVSDAILAPDDQTVYVIRFQAAFNIWALLVYFWPEIATGCGALAALLLLRSTRRALRFPQLAGKPHCRTCNYCLEGCVAGRCPECGRPARRPVLGRSLRQRLVPRAVFLLIAVGAAVAPWTIPKLPRTGPVAYWMDWRSVTLAKWLSSHSRASWYTAASHVLARVEVLNLETGQRRALCRLPMGQRALRLTPDGTALLLAGNGGARLVDMQTGRTRKAVHWARVPGAAEPFVGFSPDTNEVWLRRPDAKRMRSELIAWDFVAGSTRVLLAADAWWTD